MYTAAFNEGICRDSREDERRGIREEQIYGMWKASGKVNQWVATAKAGPPALSLRISNIEDVAPAPNSEEMVQQLTKEDKWL